MLLEAYKLDASYVSRYCIIINNVNYKPNFGTVSIRTWVTRPSGPLVATKILFTVAHVSLLYLTKQTI